MKKKFLIVGSVLLGILILVLLCMLINDLSGTMSDNQIIEYCKKEIGENGNNFSVKDNIDGLDGYRFIIVKSNTESESQKLFAFKKTTSPLLGDRWVCAINENGFFESSKAVGSILFTPRNENGEKHQTDAMLFFSGNSEKIDKCGYTISINGNEEIKEIILDSNEAFVFSITDLGSTDETKKTFIKAEFYRESCLVHRIEKSE